MWLPACDGQPGRSGTNGFPKGVTMVDLVRAVIDAAQPGVHPTDMNCSWR
jgi:hypothetical protein